jgi:hypothetical protein
MSQALPKTKRCPRCEARTARQIYYQFVSRGWLENEPRNYKLMTSLITDARYAGIVDWQAIEDRGREPINPPEYDSLRDLVDAALNSYRLPRWKGQKAYVELWVEKQEHDQHIKHGTAWINANTRGVVVLYLGDHDPSGEDMVRDIRDRLREFNVWRLEVEKLGLTPRSLTRARKRTSRSMAIRVGSSMHFRHVSSTASSIARSLPSSTKRR